MKWHRNYFHLLSSRSHIGCCLTRASPNCLSTFSWKLTLRDFIFCLGAKVINIMGKMFQNWCKGTVAHANSNQTGHCFYFPDCTSFLIVHTTVLDPPFGSSAACSVIFFLRTDGPILVKGFCRYSFVNGSGVPFLCSETGTEERKYPTVVWP